MTVETDLRPRTRKPKKRGPLHAIGLVLSVLLLLTVLFFATILIVIPKASGSIPLTVLTNSMAPGLPPGTLIIVQPVAMDDIVIGDVLTYQIRSGEPDLITHRVIGITAAADGEQRFILQGDNNASADEPVRPLQVQGRMWYSVPYVGHINSLVNGENRSWIVAVIAGLFLSYAAYMIISGIFGRKRPKRSRADDAA